MINKILPQSLQKMMTLVMGKHLSMLRMESVKEQTELPAVMREIVAVKCLIDFRIAYY